MQSGGNSRQGPQGSAAPAQQPTQPPPPPAGMTGQPAGYPQYPQYPPPGAGYPQGGAAMQPPPPGQPGAYPGVYPGYFPPAGYPPYGYGMPPPQPPTQPTRRDRTRQDGSRDDSQRQQTRPTAVQEEEDEEEEDDDEDAETEYLDTDEESEPESVPSIDLNDMYNKFRKFSRKEPDLDKKFGMRTQIREPIASPYEKKSCTCVPRPAAGGNLPMIYESKRCICGYGTEKMIQDLRKPVRLLWSPEEELLVDEHVRNYNRVVPEKLKLPNIPGTAPAARELRPKAKTRLRALPGTSHGRPADPLVAKKRPINSFLFDKARNRRKPPRVGDELIPDDEFEPEFKESIVRKGKYYDAKLGTTVEYRMVDVNNTVIGKKKTV